MDPGRVGQHGLEIVLAVCQIFCVHREPVGKRITAAIELADDPAGSPPDPQPTGRTLSQGWSRTRRLLRQRAPSLPPVPRDSASRIREPVGLAQRGRPPRRRRPVEPPCRHRSPRRPRIRADGHRDSNAARVELFHKGRSLGTKPTDTIGYVAWTAPFVDGDNKLTARAITPAGKRLTDRATVRFTYHAPQLADPEVPFRRRVRALPTGLLRPR
ncbi:DUF4982 domain-containing protein [Streptomyces mirabilis]|uniref:DUF4982 domain-containing protein n=2 Tax=Streptomyces TaxID=1883 RepID=UPI003D9E60D3